MLRVKVRTGTLAPHHLIPLIYGGGNVSKIFPTVVGLVAVNMVNLIGRPRTRHQKECKAMSIQTNTDRFYPNVSPVVAARTSHSTNQSFVCFPSGYSANFPGVRVVREKPNSIFVWKSMLAPLPKIRDSSRKFRHHSTQRMAAAQKNRLAMKARE